MWPSYNIKKRQNKIINGNVTRKGHESNSLKVSKSQNKVVEPQILQKYE